MGKIIAFANQKGGVGKTTSAVNIAASLGVLGYKVLMIDLDPQGNATSGVGVIKKSLKMTAFDLLTTDATVQDVMIKTRFDNLSIIPTNTTLARAEYELADVENGEFVIKNKLAPVLDGFDYVIIDCPPSLGMLTVNAMTAANGVVIPMQCEFFALEGLGDFLVELRSMRKKLNPSLVIEGVVLTMFDGRTKLAQQITKEVEDYFGEKLFKTVIPRNIRLVEAPSHGKDIFQYDKRSKGAKAYMSLAEELLGERKGWLR